MVQENSDLIVNIGTSLGWLIAAGLSGLVMYWKTKPPRPADPVLAGVGMELGNKLQMEQLTHEVKRCADSLAILADRKQAVIEDKLAEVLERLEEAEHGGRRVRS